MSWDANEALGQLRQSLAQPSEEHLATLSKLLDEWPQEQFQVAFEFASQHLQDWPEELRVWRRAELPPHIAPLFPTHEPRMPSSASLGPAELSLFAEVEGAYVQPQVYEGGALAWVQHDRRSFSSLDLHTGELRRTQFRRMPKDGHFILHPDGEHLLRKHDREFQVWHVKDSIVARAKVPRPPRSRWSGYEADGWSSSLDFRSLWYAGFDSKGKPLLYLFDALTLQLLDTTEVRSTITWTWGEDKQESRLLESWGEDPSWFGQSSGEKWMGLLSNVGDSVSFVCFFRRTEEDTIEQLLSQEHEDAVRFCSDQRVFGAQFLPKGRSLLVLDDISHLSLLHFERGAAQKILRAGNPLRYLADESDLLTLPKVPGAALLYTFQLERIFCDSRLILLEYDYDYHRGEPPDHPDFPRYVLLALCGSTFQPLSFLTSRELEPLREKDDEYLWSWGVCAADCLYFSEFSGLERIEAGRKTRFYRWNPGAPGTPS